MNISDIPETMLVPEYISLQVSTEGTYHQIFYKEHFYDYTEYELDRYKNFWTKLIGELYPNIEKEVSIHVEKHKYWQELRVGIASENIGDFMYAITQMLMLYGVNHLIRIKKNIPIESLVNNIADLLGNTTSKLLQNPYFDSEMDEKYKQSKEFTMILPEHFNTTIYKENDTYFYKYEETFFHVNESIINDTKNLISHIFNLEETTDKIELDSSGDGNIQSVRVKVETKEIAPYIFSIVGELLINAIMHKYRENGNSAEDANVILPYILNYIDGFSDVVIILNHSMIDIDSNTPKPEE